MVPPSVDPLGLNMEISRCENGVFGNLLSVGFKIRGLHSHIFADFWGK